jgi:hypothetical protein
LEVNKSSFIEDEGRPFEIGFQEQVSNYLKQLPLRVVVVSVEEKSTKVGMYGSERRINLNHC